MLHPVNSEAEYLQLLNAVVRYCKSKAIVLLIIERALLIQISEDLAIHDGLSY